MCSIFQLMRFQFVKQVHHQCMLVDAPLYNAISSCVMLSYSIPIWRLLILYDILESRNWQFMYINKQENIFQWWIGITHLSKRFLKYKIVILFYVFMFFQQFLRCVKTFNLSFIFFNIWRKRSHHQLFLTKWVICRHYILEDKLRVNILHGNI